MESAPLNENEQRGEDPLLHPTTDVENPPDQTRRQCRICLEEEEETQISDEGDDPLIAPCRCKGSQEWVHRKCLDDWRATNPNHIAFSKCTECLADYKMVYAGPSAGRREYCCYVTRDISLGCSVLLLCIFLLGWLVWLSFAQNDSNTGVSTLFGISIAASSVLFRVLSYSMTGFVLVLVLLGIYGLGMFFSYGCSMTDTIAGLEGTANAITRVSPPPTHEVGAAPLGWSMDRSVTPRTNESRRRHHHHHRRRSTDDDGECCCCPHCDGVTVYYCSDACGNGCCRGCCDGDGCGGCECPSGGGGGTGGSNDTPIMGFILLAMVVLLATLGMLVGVFLSFLLINQILQRHLFRLHKQRLTKNFVVVDLSGRSPPPRGRVEPAAAADLPEPVPPPTDEATAKMPPALPPPCDAKAKVAAESPTRHQEADDDDDDQDVLVQHRDYLEQLGLL